MEYLELEKKVLRWAKNKEIFSKGNPLAQSRKTMEESLELHEAILMCPDEIAMELGDCLVTLIIQAEMNDLDPLECLELAYNKISKRDGEMRKGSFVKSDDL